FTSTTPHLALSAIRYLVCKDNPASHPRATFEALDITDDCSWEIASSNGLEEDLASPKKPRYEREETIEGFSDIYRAVNLASAPAHQEILARLPAGVIFELARMCLTQGKDPNDLDPNWLCRLETTHAVGLPLIAKHASTGQSQSVYGKVAESLDWEANSIVRGDGTMLECQPAPTSLLDGEEL
ncbi:15536_t:CDS:2, partial [Acaulospora colombiana]